MARPAAPARVDWYARRGQPFARTILVQGVDLTNATARSQVRAYPDATTVLFDLVAGSYPIATNATARTAITVDKSGSIPMSTIYLWIPQSAIDALEPFATNGTEPGQMLAKAWDCLVTPANDLPATWFAGDFFLVPGVTK
jgi:hypothetical protein